MNEMLNYINKFLPEIPKFSIVLGSGLSNFSDNIKEKKKISYSKIPSFPNVMVSGHKGEFVFGYLNEIPILCARGRFHLYQGLSISDVVSPIKLFSKLKIPNLIITNSAGCINYNWKIGDLMLIIGHVDCTFKYETPKINVDKNIYKKINQLYVHKISKKLNINIREGIYAWTLGPTYETPAEINMIRNFGGDAVGMSTVPEIIEAGKLNMNCFGLTCFTNMASGIKDEILSHSDVLMRAKKHNKKLTSLITEMIISL